MSSKNLSDFNFVIFGGDGDLALKKIFPALYQRLNDDQIHDNSKIVVLSKNEKDSEQFRNQLNAELLKRIPEADQKCIARLCAMTTYIKIEITNPEDYESLRLLLSTNGHNHSIFYYSTPSSLFGYISAGLHGKKLIDPNSKVVLEKPLGSDLKTFEELNKTIRKYFKEYQIYRIDHYLGKETVQNIMVLRFANYLFELAWNRQHIDYVEITVAESLGVESRKDYYDKYGALKDMVQNHLLQLLCLVAMEAPSELNADNVRNEKLKVLHALQKYGADDIKKATVKGQYTRGKIGDAHVNSYQEDIEGYGSTTETFVALRVFIQNWRWAGVPFYLRTGKRMPERYSEIVINFKPVPQNIFPEKAPLDRNKLVIRLQPDEHIELEQIAKIPGPGGYRYKSISLDMDYKSSIGKQFPDAYERLIMDVIRGNQTLFMREDEVRASWEWIHSIIDHWEGQELKLYQAGTQALSDDVLMPGHEWNKI